MVRCLNSKEIATRAEIKARKNADPSLTVRRIACLMKTSPKVVVAALKKTPSEWQAESARRHERLFPATVYPSNPPDPLTPRGYQADAAARSVGRNTLLVLPTGLGKTVVALLHVKAILAGFAIPGRGGIVAMLAPTKALLVQHRDLFQKHLGIADVGLAIVDGETDPDNRKGFYGSLAEKRCVLFMTPQTFHNDIVKGRLAREWVVDIVVDEAHHATAGDPYHLACEDLREHGCKPRVLAMTASPGESEARIVEVCTNLGIDPADAVIKTREDVDVAPHVFRLDVVRYAVDLTPEYEEIRGLLVDVLREPCSWLEAAGVGVARKEDVLGIPSMTTLKDLMEQYTPPKVTDAESDGKIDESVVANLDPDPPSDVDLEALAARPSVSKWEVVSRLAAAMKARHAIELVETQGLAALLAYDEKQAATLDEKPSKATVAVLQHPKYGAAMRKATKLVKDGAPAALHPKLGALREMLARFVAEKPASRCIVFTKYRASIDMIIAQLSAVPGTKAGRFVGQGSTSPSDAGMDRDMQQAALREFKGGAFNVLVATKAAEEGLDVADCDLVVFYEATASVIQFIQRQGRAGRRRDGTVAILLANSTVDAVHAAVLDGKLASLPGIYYNVQRIRRGMPVTTPKPAITVSKQRVVARVKPGALFDKELVRELRARNIDAVLDPDIAGDVALPGGIGVRIITSADAEYWEPSDTHEELEGVTIPVLAIWSNNDDELHLCKNLGAKVITFAGIAPLGHLIENLVQKEPCRRSKSKDKSSS